jgi:hypothetical protein
MMDEQRQAIDQWHMESLNISVSKYGEDAGRYTGKVTFSNKDYESISLKINQEQAGRFLAIIADELHMTTGSICTMLVQSIKAMINPPKKVEELPEETSDVQSEG